MPEPMNFPFRIPDAGIMSLRSQLENQMAQVNCSLAIQMQLTGMTSQYMPAWVNYSIPVTPYSVQTCCCDDGSSYRPKKTNCVNCGASLQGKHKCSYCDTYNE